MPDALFQRMRTHFQVEKSLPSTPHRHMPKTVSPPNKTSITFLPLHLTWIVQGDTLGIEAAVDVPVPPRSEVHSVVLVLSRRGQMNAQYEVYQTTPSGARHVVNQSQTLKDAVSAAMLLCIQLPGNYAVFAINSEEPIFEMNLLEHRPPSRGDGKGYKQ